MSHWLQIALIIITMDMSVTAGESSPFAGELIDQQIFHEKGVIDEGLMPADSPLIDDPRTQHVPWTTILHSLLVIAWALCLSIAAFLYFRKRKFRRRQIGKFVTSEPRTDISYATVGGLPTIDEESPLGSFQSMYHSFDLLVASDPEY